MNKILNIRPCTFLLLAAMSLPSSLHAKGATKPAADLATGPTAQFQVSEKTQVPGHLLKPGNYTVTVVDHLADRTVLRINNDAGKEETTFLAVNPTAAFPSGSTPGPVAMNVKGGHSAALRGFVFPGGTRAEFVYLKAEAVPLAKTNNTTLVAIDPSSEGRPDKDNLSAKDRELVTLWMLTPTVVGKTQAMEAQRYQVAADAKPSAPQYWEVPAVRAGTDRAPRVPTVTTERAPRTNIATNNPPPPPHRVANPIATLPHTASSQPLFLLAGFFSIFTAGFLSFRRFTGASIR